ncbi:MAG TPA: hypothetical protein EYP69_04755, partial [Bacteroidales bacterium]|nr:hypothetical protein [Bacteroidales bacterium]
MLPFPSWNNQLHSDFLTIAGPCSVESEEQVLQTARKIRELTDVQVFRAGVWKPRTRPDSFEGVGEKAFPWLKKVKQADDGTIILPEDSILIVWFPLLYFKQFFLMVLFLNSS